jgi:hypothetical protein
MALPKTLAKSKKRRKLAEFRVAFSLDTFFWPKIAPAFSAFATSLWLAKRKKESRLSGRDPTSKPAVAPATPNPSNHRTNSVPKPIQSQRKKHSANPNQGQKISPNNTEPGPPIQNSLRQ